MGTIFGVFNKCSGLQTLGQLIELVALLVRHAHRGKHIHIYIYMLNHLICHFNAPLVVFKLICVYWIKGILYGYAIRSDRHPEWSQWPSGWPTGFTHAESLSLTSPCCSGWPAPMNTPQGQQRELISDGCADINAWSESDLVLITNFNSTHKQHVNPHTWHKIYVTCYCLLLTLA